MRSNRIPATWRPGLSPWAMWRSSRPETKGPLSVPEGRTPKSSRSDMAKRIFDLLVGGLLVLVLSPVMGLVALAVLLDLGPPVLLRQSRPGLRGKPFVLFKFRTMRDE